MRVTLTRDAVEHIRKKGGRAAVDLICMSTRSTQVSEVSVDTYIGRRNTDGYMSVRLDGVEVLVSNAITPFVRQISLDLSRFLFLRSLKASLELHNGTVVAT